jgi:hypothetical protein
LTNEWVEGKTSKKKIGQGRRANKEARGREGQRDKGKRGKKRKEGRRD